MQTLLLILILVPAPAPKIEQARAHPIVGVWAINWGSCLTQTTTFYADGTCHSPEYGGGTWAEDADGRIWFSEQDGTEQYMIESATFLDRTGSVWHYFNGQRCLSAELRMRPGEWLPMPREIN